MCMSKECPVHEVPMYYFVVRTRSRGSLKALIAGPIQMPRTQHGYGFALP